MEMLASAFDWGLRKRTFLVVDESFTDMATHTVRPIGGKIADYPMKFSKTYRGVLLLCALISTAAGVLHAEDRQGAESVDTAANTTHTWQFAPPTDFYPIYLADPRRPQGAVLITSIIDSEIPDSGSPRWGTRLGGRFPLVRRHENGRPEVGYQLDFEAGIFAHFDAENGDDNIGWDGVFGLLLSWKPRPELGFRFGLQHDSAHVGDEYKERTGRQRIDYTRQELVLGSSWAPTKEWRGYLEGAYAFNDMKDFQEPLRFQGGLEYFGRKSWRDDRIRWYAAADVTSFEERDWKVTPTLQLGLILPSEFRTGRYRLALEYGSGRSALGEFSFHDESYVALGWYFDM